MAAGADDSAAAHRERPAAGSKGSRRRRASGRSRRSSGRWPRRARWTRVQLRERLEARRRPDRGPGAGPPLLPAWPARDRSSAARWSASSTPTSWSRDWLGPQPEVDRDGGAGRAGAPLPGRPRARRRPRPGALGGAAAAGRPRRAGGDRRGARGARGRPSRAGRRRRLPAELPPPRLLGAFDPVLLGWTSREDILGPHTELVTVNGLFRPFAMVEGRAVATWRLAKGKVAIEPLGTDLEGGPRRPRRRRRRRRALHGRITDRSKSPTKLTHLTRDSCVHAGLSLGA